MQYRTVIRSLISEMIESNLQESEINADALVHHMNNVDYDEHRPNKSDMKKMATKKPAASFNHGDYSSHLHHTNTHTIIHHGSSDPSNHEMHDGYHKVKGHVSPNEFHKAMKNISEN